MIDLLCALDLWWVMGEVLVDGEVEVEHTAFVQAFVGVDGKSEVENIVGVGEVRFHRATER